MDSYQIKLASFNEIKLMLEWAKNEGWNPGLNDANAFQIVDPHGFFIGYLGPEPISCISNVKYNHRYSFLGLYIVKPEYRGKGYGYKIWQYAMQYTADCNVGLDGVIAQQANYVKSGFKFSHRNIRYILRNNKLNQTIDSHLIPANSLPLPYTLAYDKQFFPGERASFLITWLLMHNAKAFIFYDAGVQGYGVIRKCSEGYKVGPLFANTQQIASEIFRGLCSLVEENQAIYLDIPEININAKLLVEQLAMQAVFETARMYTKSFPQVSINNTFGITTFELG